MTISLEKVAFHGRHGLFPQETRVGNEFVVDLSVRIPYSEGIGDDDIDGTVSYADLYAIVKEEMAIPRKLLETAAAAIAARITEKWDIVESGCVTICKSNPPIAGMTGTAKISLEF